MVLTLAHALISGLSISDSQMAAAHVMISKDVKAASALLGAKDKKEQVAIIILLINKAGQTSKYHCRLSFKFISRPHFLFFRLSLQELLCKLSEAD